MKESLGRMKMLQKERFMLVGAISHWHSSETWDCTSASLIRHSPRDARLLWAGPTERTGGSSLLFDPNCKCPSHDGEARIGTWRSNVFILNLQSGTFTGAARPRH
jgi:hypothetical protein